METLLGCADPNHCSVLGVAWQVQDRSLQLVEVWKPLCAEPAGLQRPWALWLVDGTSVSPTWARVMWCLGRRVPGGHTCELGRMAKYHSVFFFLTVEASFAR